MLDLRTALRLDAAASAGLGVLLAALAGVLDEPLGLPTALSLGAGLGLIGWGAFVASVARRPSDALVKEVIAINVAWVVASFGYGLFGALPGLGTTLVLLQAVAVLGLTEAQWLARRRHALTA